ncbi:MFS transporter [Alphaproteobacteria bacterium]|nr:MFS transporter [Alphaproteobacteria bacterium]
MRFRKGPTLAENKKPDEVRLTRRAEWTAYSTAFISIGILPMIQLIVPLWCLVSLGMSATMIGIAAGARSALATVFSIHSGAMLDRLGVRRVMIFCAITSIVLTLLYPLVPAITSVIAIQLAIIVILQLLTGFLHTIGWIGSQTQIGQLTRGSPKHMGRFTSITNFSSFFTPPLAGWAWDIGQGTGIGGAWPAFGVIALLNILLWISVSLMPIPQSVSLPKGPPKLSALLPSLLDYKEAFRLFLLPTVAFVVIGSFLMNGVIQVRMNFLSLYMESVGYEGRIIGFISGFAFLIAGVTALRTDQAKRYLAPYWIVIFMVLLVAVGNGIVPLFEGIPGLTLTTILFGIGVGLGMAFVLTLLSRSVPISQFGLSVGLRTTGNRFGATVLPPIAGFAIDMAGGDVGAGFYITSIMFTLGAVGMAILALSSKTIQKSFSKD